MKYLLLFLPLFAQAQNSHSVITDHCQGHDVVYQHDPLANLLVSPEALTTTPKLSIVDARQDTFSPMFTTEPGGWTITENGVVVLDCFPFEEFTEWATDVQSKYSRIIHVHDWVYAEHSDVNQSRVDLQTAMYCPCGCPKTDNEARICRVCFMHQTRTRTYGHRPRTEESEYIKLKKKAKQ